MMPGLSKNALSTASEYLWPRLKKSGRKQACACVLVGKWEGRAQAVVQHLTFARHYQEKHEKC